MPPARKPSQGKNEEPIRDDDEFDPDIPGDEDDDEPERVHELKTSVEAGEAEGGDFVHKGEPHPHLHTPGYPAHRHKGDIVDHDAGETYASGGEELFDRERHDRDIHQAEGLEQDRKDA